MSDELVGKKLGAYEILELVGSGSSAYVYRARHTVEGRIVALKLFIPEFLEVEDFLSRFTTEIRLVANTQHYHVVPIFDVGELNSRPFMAMRYLDGGTLLDWINRMGQMPLEMVLPVVKQIASALDHIHGRGIIHRDVRPHNIIFDSNSEAYLTDFNVPVLSQTRMKVTGLPALAHPAYIAPELTTSDPAPSAASDIYSLGVTLFHALTGSLPFEANTPEGMMIAHRERPFPSVQRFNPMLTQDVEIVLMKAMAKKPDDRFDKALDLTAALAQSIGVDIETTNRLDIEQVQEQAQKLDADKAKPEPQADIATEESTPVDLELADKEKIEDFSNPTPILRMPAKGVADKEKDLGDEPITRQFSSLEAARQQETRQEIVRPTPPPRRKRVRRTTSAPWYFLLPTIILLILGWFVVGSIIGFEARRQVNSVTLSAIHSEQTRSAVTQTLVYQETQVANLNDSQTQQAIDSAATPTPTITPSAMPTATPTLTATPSPTPTLIGGSQGRIVLVSDRDGDDELFLLDLGTDELIRLTDNNADDNSPVWSPDGQWIAYSSLATAQQRSHIFAIDPVSGERQELTSGIRTDEYPLWATHGEVIVFASEEGGRFYIRSVTPDGGAEQDLQQLPVPVRPLDWAPDGLTMVGYGRTPPDNHLEIMLLDLGNGLRTPITNQVGLITFADVSPDGTKIVFTFRTPDKRQLFIADLTCDFINECNATRLTQDFFNYYTPRFSPDGSRLLVASDRSGHLDLFIMDLNGNIIERVTESPFDEYQGDWEPLPLDE